MKQLVEGFTNEDLAYKIDSEGLPYFFSCYMSADKIIDPELKEAAIKLSEALNKIEKILEDNGASL